MIKQSEKLILLVLLFCASLLLNAQNDNIIDKVIWIVGDEAILKSDVEEARIGMLAQGQRIEGDPYCFIPEQLAVRKLYLDQAKVDSIEITNSQLSKEVTRRENYYIANVGGGSKEKLEEYWGMNINQIREQLLEQLRTEELTSEVQKKLTANITLTPSEVRKYYSQLPQDSLPFIETSVEVQIITNDPQIPLKEVDVVKGRLRDFTNRVNSGEMDFSTLAILYSEDPGSAANGGELGFMGRALLDPAFSNVAFSLSDSKKVSNIVESENGFHIIQLVERRGDRGNFRHILLRPKVPTEEMNKSKDRLAELRDSINTKAIRFEEAVEILSFDKDTRKSEGLMVNHKQAYDGRSITTSKFIMEDLPPEISRVVDTMKVGDISAPFVMRKTNGKETVAIVKLKSRTEGHLANVADDYEDLRQLVEEKKREEILTKWVQRKIRDVYVHIDEDWVKCDFKYEGWLKDDKKK